MKKSYFRYLLLMELAENEQVRELVAQIMREAIPEPEREPDPMPVHRPISAPVIPQPQPVRTNTAPGAI